MCPTSPPPPKSQEQLDALEVETTRSAIFCTAEMTDHKSGSTL